MYRQVRTSRPMTYMGTMNRKLPISAFATPMNGMGRKRRRHIKGRGKVLDWLKKAGSWIKDKGPGIGRAALKIFQNPAVRNLAGAYAPSSTRLFNAGDKILDAANALSGNGRRRVRLHMRSKNGCRMGRGLGYGLG